ncbi:shikimate kinase AroK [Tahibacter amnicola]|uniref:Shikimate kinase n=1 Tax=Tahibacter amnicola TaxID=2976241 RepID=A0ABY6BJS1_9GAMM|nr:shikimate kinase AroK [Tahibacter amnicola]UXI69335.1 shikimate kinase AroK [Tahibacter amnicola]
MNPAPNLFLVGPMGAGKTTIGRRVAEHLHLPFHDLDQIIEEETGATIPLIFELEGEPGFRRREHDCLAAMTGRQGIVLATGGGAVLDPANRQLLATRGFVVWLETSVEQQLSRLARDKKRPLLAAPDRRERLEQMAQVRNPLYQEVSDMIMHSSCDRVPQVALELASQLERQWHRSTTVAA